MVMYILILSILTLANLNAQAIIAPFDLHFCEGEGIDMEYFFDYEPYSDSEETEMLSEEMDNGPSDE